MGGIEISIENSSVGAVHVLHPKLNPHCLPATGWRAGAKQVLKENVLCMGCPLSPASMQGTRGKAGRNPTFFPFDPRDGQQEERAGKLVLMVS
jgi:hypothetical protein